MCRSRASTEIPEQLDILERRTPYGGETRARRARSGHTRQTSTARRECEIRVRIAIRERAPIGSAFPAQKTERSERLVGPARRRAGRAGRRGCALATPRRRCQAKKEKKKQKPQRFQRPPRTRLVPTLPWAFPISFSIFSLRETNDRGRDFGNCCPKSALFPVCTESRGLLNPPGGLRLASPPAALRPIGIPR